jgi:citrate-Mg2+:H+ or citrate-Ca2+:H+ symporter, CitMHS family
MPAIPGALLGALSVVILLAAIMSRRVSPLVALILVPIVAALVGGHGLAIADYVVEGIKTISPVAGTVVFAILYFGVVTDAGLFDPVITRLLKLAGNRPAHVALGTAVLAALVHLDGSGAVTFLIVIPAFAPIYDRLGMDRRVLACTAAMAAGVNNMLPWGGPTLRAAGALNQPMAAIYNPLIVPQIIGLCAAFGFAYWLGKREERRLDWQPGAAVEPVAVADRPERNPRMLWPNVVVTVAIMLALIEGSIAPVVVFMVGTVIALAMNYPGTEAQHARIDAHARAACMIASILLAAGAFMGVMKGAGFLSDMSNAVAGHVPATAASHVPFVLALLSMPLSLLFDPDSFYFGVLPVVAEVMAHFDVPVTQVAHAALLGQMTTGFPVSPLTPATYLLVGLARIDLADHQRFTIPWLFAITVVMTLVCILLRVFPI